MEYELLLPRGLTKEEVNDTYGRYVVTPLERGYGVTIGNALRRVLLSSIEGAAIVAARFDGVLHEFATLPGVYEEITEIILNLKKVRIRFDNPELRSATLRIFAEGVREVKAGDIQTPADVTIVNKDVHIASLTTEDAKLIGELFVTRGYGYVPSEDIPKEGFPANTIVMDGIFSPITKVNYTVENVRVKARTDYEKLTLEIWTDGTIHPDKALEKASEILRNSFEAILNSLAPKEETQGAEQSIEQISQEELLGAPIEQLGLPKRTLNTLQEAGIKTVAELISKTEAEILSIKNLGEKTLQEIKEKLEKFGLSFATEEEKS